MTHKNHNIQLQEGMSYTQGKPMLITAIKAVCR